MLPLSFLCQAQTCFFWGWFLKAACAVYAKCTLLQNWPNVPLPIETHFPNPKLYNWLFYSPHGNSQLLLVNNNQYHTEPDLLGMLVLPTQIYLLHRFIQWFSVDISPTQYRHLWYDNKTGISSHSVDLVHSFLKVGSINCTFNMCTNNVNHFFIIH